MNLPSRLLTVFCCVVLLGPSAAAAALFSAPQTRDHLTGEEADLVREAQAIDKRSEVFIRAVERRVLALTDPKAAESKQIQKELEKWGPLPSGSRFELFIDIAKILDEAITNIDDFSSRSPNSELLPKALRKLSDASAKLLTQLEPLRGTSRGPERTAYEQIVEHAETVIGAAKKLPAGETKK